MRASQRIEVREQVLVVPPNLRAAGHLASDREELVFKVLDSPFAEVYGPSTQPVCYTILGVLRGVAMTLFDKPAHGAEVQCAAKGDNCCRFVVSGAPG